MSSLPYVPEVDKWASDQIQKGFKHKPNNPHSQILAMLWGILNYPAYVYEH